MLWNITGCIDKHFFYNICFSSLSLYRARLETSAPPQTWAALHLLPNWRDFKITPNNSDFWTSVSAFLGTFATARETFSLQRKTCSNKNLSNKESFWSVLLSEQRRSRTVCCRSPRFPSNRMRWLWGCLHTNTQTVAFTFQRGDVMDDRSRFIICRTPHRSAFEQIILIRETHEMKEMKRGGKTQPPPMRLFVCGPVGLKSPWFN